MMFLPHIDNQHIGFEDCPSSPLSRKPTSALNEESFSTPKSKYKSVEKHAHELINTPKPSSKKKSILSHKEHTLELPNFDDDVVPNILPLNVHRQLSTIQENVDDDKENNQNYFNQYQRHCGAPEKYIKKLNLADQQYQNEPTRVPENEINLQINNIFSSLNVSDFNENMCAVGSNNMLQNNYSGNRLTDFFNLFNMKNDEIQNIFDMNAQFEIINSGLSSSVAENIMQLNTTFSCFYFDSNTLQVDQQGEVYIISLQGTAIGYSINPMKFFASAKINYSNNLISHIRIQFQ